MEACIGAHHLSRKLASLGHDARLMPAKYVRPYSKAQKNDFNDAEATAEAVQHPTLKFDFGSGVGLGSRRDRALRTSRIETKIDRMAQKSGDISQKQLDFMFLLLRGGICLMGKKR